MAYVRARYQVPAKRGKRVAFEGRLATITSASGGYIYLRFDGEEHTWPQPFHPTWHIDWDFGSQRERLAAP